MADDDAQLAILVDAAVAAGAGPAMSIGRPGPAAMPAARNRGITPSPNQ
jgi:hypothetical protein